MRIAIPQWRGRVSPVFDVAGNLLLVDLEDGREVWREEKRLPGADSVAHIPEFLKFGASTLICGAISAPVKARLVASGVEVIGFVCGKVNQVLAAYLNGDLAKGAFAMPGCRRSVQEGETAMPRGFGMGAGRGGFRHRHGRGGSMATGGPISTGSNGFCICPKCGEKTPHTPGQPCVQMVCPKCRTAKTRV
jgi:predicted Fe-Mo cluster-binding NifX family protein